MSDASKRASKTYRARMRDDGLARCEVLVVEDDKELIRAVARRLLEAGQEVRDGMWHLLEDGNPRGGIVAALRRSPLVGAELDLTRSREPSRTVEL